MLLQFFGSLFEDKVPKSQLDAAQKRLREVEKVNMRIVVDMKKFKEQQSAQLKVLTKQLDSVMKTASLEDVSFPSRKFATPGFALAASVPSMPAHPSRYGWEW